MSQATPTLHHMGEIKLDHSQVISSLISQVPFLTLLFYELSYGFIISQKPS